MRATEVPFNVARKAFFVDQETTRDWPLAIDVALALMPAATVPVDGDEAGVPVPIKAPIVVEPV